MSLETYLRERRSKESLSLMTHIICGYPSLDDNWRMLQLMDQARVAFVEFQFPFSEPVADGPLFCKANQQSIDNGTTVDDCFELMTRAKAMSFQPLMMGYYNTVFQLGHENFCKRLVAAGGKGFILPDLPPEESAELERLADAYGLAPIHLMTPTTSPTRLAQIAKHGRGFFYCVARRGVTGAHTEFSSELTEFLHRCRQATPLPLAVGFGVSSADDIAFLLSRADIAVIGSAFLKAWEERGEAGAQQLLQQLAAAARQ